MVLCWHKCEKKPRNTDTHIVFFSFLAGLVVWNKKISQWKNFYAAKDFEVNI